MTIAEIKYTDYVSSFVGIPYKWNSWDPEEGLDCRTIAVCFLRGLGYDIDGEDNIPMPTAEEIEDIEEDKDKTAGLLARYTAGVKKKGELIYDSVGAKDGHSPLQNIRKNDIVMYETPRLPHVGVYVGDDRLLAASKKHGSILIKMSMLKESIILIVRPTRIIPTLERGNEKS